MIKAHDNSVEQADEKNFPIFCEYAIEYFSFPANVGNGRCEIPFTFDEGANWVHYSFDMDHGFAIDHELRATATTLDFLERYARWAEKGIPNEY